jgi:hypothetical protein
VRALLATAGLLVLAGSALAGQPTSHTLRKSANGPIEAVAQDSNVAAWLTWSRSGPCNSVHILSPGEKDRSVPLPSADSMTCQWDLGNGLSQLAIAANASMALWTLHETTSSTFDQVLTASFGGPERQLARLSHANNGVGDWLGGVAGAGKTLAYSWVDVEYVDPELCLSGGSCKQKIADGGIRLITRNKVTALPGAKPALQLAAAGGRIAYIPAVIAKAGRPSANADSSVYIADATSGSPVGQVFVRGIPIAIALSAHVLAVLTTLAGPHDRISWYSASNGAKLGSVLVSALASPQLATNDRMVVFRVGRQLRDVLTRNGRVGKLAVTARTSLGLSLAGDRLLWAENHNGSGRLRALAVG